MLKAQIIGNLGNDPELRYSSGGTPFMRFNVASNYRARAQDGEWQDRTEWVRVTVIGKRAETLENFLKKGSRVYVDGRLEARPWTDQQGQVRSGLEITASEIQFMNARQDGDGGQAERGERQQRPAPQQNRRGDDDFDVDTLPF